MTPAPGPRPDYRVRETSIFTYPDYYLYTPGNDLSKSINLLSKPADRLLKPVKGYTVLSRKHIIDIFKRSRKTISAFKKTFFQTKIHIRRIKKINKSVGKTLFTKRRPYKDLF